MLYRYMNILLYRYIIGGVQYGGSVARMLLEAQGHLSGIVLWKERFIKGGRPCSTGFGAGARRNTGSATTG